MPEHDERGDRLRREFLRQAPAFDLEATLPGKVSALVRRRQRRRRVLAVGAAAAVVAAVAIPLSALHSAPAGHGVTPATTPTSTPSTSVPSATPTTQVAAAPVSCDTLDLWTTPTGTTITTTVTSGAVTATLTGTAVTSAGGDPSLTDPRLTVSTGGGESYSEAVAPPSGTTAVVPWALQPSAGGAAALPNSDALCLARFPGQARPTVLLGLDTGGAHCCTVVRAVSLSPSGLAAAVDDNVGNPAALVEADGEDAMIVTADNTFAYQFASFAASGMPLALLQFDGTRFVDITSQRPDLVAADASMWMKAFTGEPGNGLGLLAPWVADECVLGRSADAFATVDQLLAAGKLTGPDSWPSGAAYVQALKTFLAKQGYC